MTNTNNIQTWEEITKVKLSNYEKKEEVSQEFSQISGSNPESKTIKILKKIYDINCLRIKNNQKLEPHGNLLNIVASPDILRVAVTKLSKNKGSLTPGSEKSTADDVSENLIQKISKSILEKKFKWSNVRRIWIPKPGKTEKRPLGLPDFSNKIVQEAIRLVLTAIYEPEFQKYESNKGFRPNKSCGEAIDCILQYANGSDWVIEGDIKGAYDNVDHEILIKLLSQRIHDKNLLDLIYSGLKAGIMEYNKIQNTIMGIPQGGIASPILFNIYMHELDKYIIQNIKPEYEGIEKSDKSSSQYETLRSRRRRVAEKIRELDNPDIEIQDIIRKITHEEMITIVEESKIIDKLNPQNKRIFEQYREIILQMTPEDEEMFRTYQKLRNSTNNTTTKKLSEYTQEEQKMIQKVNSTNNKSKIFKKDLTEAILNMGIDFRAILRKFRIDESNDTRNKLLKTEYFDPEKKKIKIFYIRYADDWTLWIRGNKSNAQELKEKIKLFLYEKLKLQLSIEKTKITNPREELVHFLGFEIHYQKNPLLIRKADKYTQRFTKLQAHPDRERLSKNFINKGYMTVNGTPKEVGFLSVLKDHEIITKFNEYMLGLGNYYIRQISYPSRLNRWHYLLYYACIKTLAAKHKSTVKRIIKKYGFLDISNPNQNKKPKATDLRIIAKYYQDKNIKYSILHNYKEFFFRLNRLKENPPPSEIFDFNNMHKVNLRTAFKLTTACCIDGNKKNLESHHIRPIRHARGKYIGYKGFDKIVAALGRKQITVCRECHKKIHNGEYDGLSLNEIYDVRLVAPEGYIQVPTNPNNGSNELKKDKEKIKIEVSEDKKTYFNPFLLTYLKNKNYD